jgi:long-subunit acyl-CoA synthetase (AMP-forming)
MSGYQNRPKANAETFDEEGFMHTGDVVEINEKKYIYILDRLKEVCDLRVVIDLRVDPAHNV